MNHDHHCDDQKDMNKTAERVGSHQAQESQDDQDGCSVTGICASPPFRDDESNL